MQRHITKSCSRQSRLTESGSIVLISCQAGGNIRADRHQRLQYDLWFRTEIFILSKQQNKLLAHVILTVVVSEYMAKKVKKKAVNEKEENQKKAAHDFYESALNLLT